MLVDSVTFSYEPDAPIVVDWRAEFNAGSMTAITGPSGRGKSTLLYLLGLMLRPNRGDVWLNGVSTARLSDADRATLRATELGFVFQDAALDPTRSVMDNVTEAGLYRRHSGQGEVRSRALELLRQFEVSVPADRKPSQVSGGQAQRIALCRALLFAPRVLLADEPTGNLDPATSMLVVDAMRAHADTGASVIIVTHSPDVAASCDEEIRL